ncbi:hypothetical protein ACFWBC_13895 [Streptomyces sp. NPDC059985]|uniref:hypothetical protein n=1 Tax=Streptomyces sp. NPDC059985 TaxID=3347025 RepID=UPI0036BA3354
MTQQQEDDQNLWRSVYTTDGWSPDVAFADHLSVGAPALAEVNGTLYCAHRGARQEGETVLPVQWTSFTPAATHRYVSALEEAGRPLPGNASQEAVAEREARIQAAAAALGQAQKWTPDASVFMADSLETPAIVNDNGTLRMVFSARGGRGDGFWELYEAELDTTADTPEWTQPRFVEGAFNSGNVCVAPALAVFDGALHLAYLELEGRVVGHLVRGPEGVWKHATREDDTFVDRIEVGGDHLLDEWKKGEGMRANLSLAVHDGRLHLLHGTDLSPGRAVHSVFDGKEWRQIDMLEVAAWRTAALASFAGALHAVLPAGEDRLKHLTWTGEEKGWEDGANLDGHDSGNTPALLAFTGGPPCQEREALLLVHRGVNRWKPPAPPVPPTPSKVVERGTTVHGQSVTDYGLGAWSRLVHHVSVTPATLENGKKALIASWDAEAGYYYGFSYHPETSTSLWKVKINSGTLRLKKQGDVQFLRNADFHGSVDSSGRFRTDLVFDDLEPGTYELYLSSGTKKTGGWWYGGNNISAGGDNTDKERWTRLDCSRASVTLTIPS